MEISKAGGEKKGVWISQDGRETPYKEMATVHIINALKKMARQAEAVENQLKQILTTELNQIADQSIVEPVVSWIKNHDLVADGHDAWLSRNNPHYSELKKVLKAKQDEEKKAQEKKESSKTLSDSDAVWF